MTKHNHTTESTMTLTFTEKGKYQLSRCIITDWMDTCPFNWKPYHIFGPLCICPASKIVPHMESLALHILKNV